MQPYTKSTWSQGFLRPAARFLVMGLVGAGGGAVVVAAFAVLCGLLFTLLHGHPERILAFGGGGALAGAAAGAMAMAFGSLFDDDLFEDVVRLVFPRKTEQAEEEDQPLGRSPAPHGASKQRRQAFPAGERWNGRGAKTSWDETISSN
jgi:hypothetical protein